MGNHFLTVTGLLLVLSAPSGIHAADSAADATDRPVALFNGKDLTGWKAEGRAVWEVRDGVIVGRQGTGGAAGDLLSEEEYDDFELTVTFKVEWPANTGVWYRYQSADKAFQADILEYKQPYALTGSLYRTGKMFLTTNQDPKLVRREDWNTFVIRAVGNDHTILLNGTKVAEARDDTSGKGRIGFQVHAGEEFAKMKVSIKRVELRRLAK